MTALAEKIPPSKFKRIEHRQRKRRDGSAIREGFFQPLVQTMIQRRNSEDGQGIFAFVGPTAGVGVSYLVQILARELAQETNCRVLTGPPSLMDEDPLGAEGAGTPQNYIERMPNVWSLVSSEEMENLPEVQLENVWIDLGPQDFDYLLIDCSPLNESGDALRLSQEADGVFLVVDAGKTRRDQISYAQKMFAQTGRSLQGLILNRRTYPIPEFLYKLL
ncbi:MAG TPA: hypothetical protein VKG25_15745 [Bryobacteraceae bacterium]|nr:hypothetical protein [Bryobacteraceae bacterium]